MPLIYSTYDIIKLYYSSCFKRKGKLHPSTSKSSLMLSSGPLKICKTLWKGKRLLKKILFFDLIHHSYIATGKKICFCTPKSSSDTIKILILIIKWKVTNQFSFQNKCHFLYISLCSLLLSPTFAHKNNKRCFTSQPSRGKSWDAMLKPNFHMAQIFKIYQQLQHTKKKHKLLLFIAME